MGHKRRLNYRSSEKVESATFNLSADINTLAAPFITQAIKMLKSKSKLRSVTPHSINTAKFCSATATLSSRNALNSFRWSYWANVCTVPTHGWQWARKQWRDFMWRSSDCTADCYQNKTNKITWRMRQCSPRSHCPVLLNYYIEPDCAIWQPLSRLTLPMHGPFLPKTRNGWGLWNRPCYGCGSNSEAPRPCQIPGKISCNGWGWSRTVQVTGNGWSEEPASTVSCREPNVITYVNFMLKRWDVWQWHALTYPLWVVTPHRNQETVVILDVFNAKSSAAHVLEKLPTCAKRTHKFPGSVLFLIAPPAHSVSSTSTRIPRWKRICTILNVVARVWKVQIWRVMLGQVLVRKQMRDWRRCMIVSSLLFRPWVLDHKSPDVAIPLFTMKDSLTSLCSLWRRIFRRRI